DRAARLQRGFGDEHRQRRLAGAHVAQDPQSPAALEVLVDVRYIAAHRGDLVGRASGQVTDRRAIEGHALVAARDAPGEAARTRAGDARAAAAAVAGRVGLLVDQKAAAVAHAERAALLALARHRR